MSSRRQALREHDVPPRGAAFFEIAKFAESFPGSPSRESNAQLAATWRSTGAWEGTLDELLGRLYFDVRRIHHSYDNDPDMDELETLYSLLDAVRSRVKIDES